MYQPQWLMIEVHSKAFVVDLFAYFSFLGNGREFFANEISRALVYLSGYRLNLDHWRNMCMIYYDTDPQELKALAKGLDVPEEDRNTLNLTIVDEEEVSSKQLEILLLASPDFSLDGN